jgi:hypothetical protein
MTATAAPAVKTTNLTPTCQKPSPFTTAGLIAALEQAWTAIRTRHPDVPAAVVIVGSSPTKPNQNLTLGQFDPHRWQAGTDRIHEVLISGEGLTRTPAEVFTTLLHEATHGVANTRSIKDTSRQGRWHNKNFATLAAELGMTTTKDPKLGYSPCTLADTTTAIYADSINTLAAALSAYRHRDLAGEPKTRPNNNNGIACECECPRKLRIARSVFDEGPILCAICSTAFTPEDVDRDEYETEHLASFHFGNHDQADNTPNRTDEQDNDMVFYDPDGVRYGMPTYPYKMAPEGLATTRQLRTRGLRPGGQDIAAQILWRKGKRKAYLYRIDAALPKRTATPAQLAALGRAMTALRTCPTCGQVKGYYIPRRYGECLDCASEVNR